MSKWLSQRTVPQLPGVDHAPDKCKGKQTANRPAGFRLPPDDRRIQTKSAAIKEALRGCGGRELEMLIRYYVGGQETGRIAAEMGASPDELALLRARIRKVAIRWASRGATATF